jgi:hypothetical protein
MRGYAKGVMMFMHKHDHQGPDIPAQLKRQQVGCDATFLQSAIRPFLEAVVLLQLLEELRGAPTGTDNSGSSGVSNGGDNSGQDSQGLLSRHGLEQLFAVVTPVLHMILAADSSQEAEAIQEDAADFLQKAKAQAAISAGPAEAQRLCQQAVQTAASVLRAQHFLWQLQRAPQDWQDTTAVFKVAESGPVTYGMRMGQEGLAGFMARGIALVLSSLRGIGSTMASELHAQPVGSDRLGFNSTTVAHVVQHTSAAVAPHASSLDRGTSPSLQNTQNIATVDRLVFCSASTMLSVVARCSNTQLHPVGVQRVCERAGGLVPATDRANKWKLLVLRCVLGQLPVGEPDVQSLLTVPAGVPGHDSARAKQLWRAESFVAVRGILKAFGERTNLARATISHPILACKAQVSFVEQGAWVGG